MRVCWGKFAIHFDRDYGIDRRTGWSIAIDGSFVVQFEKHLLVALILMMERA